MEGTVVFPDRSNDTKRRVLVIGAAGLDIVGRPIGMPEPGTSTPAKVRPSFGGVAHNIAVNLAHLGQRSANDPGRERRFWPATPGRDH